MAEVRSDSAQQACVGKALSAHPSPDLPPGARELLSSRAAGPSGLPFILVPLFSIDRARCVVLESWTKGSTLPRLRKKKTAQRPSARSATRLASPATPAGRGNSVPLSHPPLSQHCPLSARCVTLEALLRSSVATLGQLVARPRAAGGGRACGAAPRRPSVGKPLSRSVLLAALRKVQLSIRPTRPTCQLHTLVRICRGEGWQGSLVTKRACRLERGVAAHRGLLVHQMKWRRAHSKDALLAEQWEHLAPHIDSPMARRRAEGSHR